MADDDDSLDLKPIETPRVKFTPVAKPVAAPAEPGAPVRDPLVERLRHAADVAQAGGMTSVAGGAAVIVCGSFALALAVYCLFWIWFDSTGLGLTAWTILFM